MRGLVVRQRLCQRRQFSAKLIAFIFWRERRNEYTAPKLRIFERAMKPHAELPRELEHRERCAVVAGEGVVCGIPTPPKLAEELEDFVWQDTALAQSAEEIALALLRLPIQPDVGRGSLGEDFCKLTQL